MWEVGLEAENFVTFFVFVGGGGGGGVFYTRKVYVVSKTSVSLLHGIYIFRHFERLKFGCLTYILLLSMDRDMPS